VPVWELLGGKVREACPVYGWVGGDRPSDVLAQAKVRKEQGFTRVKMNVRYPDTCTSTIDVPNHCAAACVRACTWGIFERQRGDVVGATTDTEPLG
jgi:L-alanine-DL-glutamate epimerase-like enolase superfamily enzyme